MSVTVPPKPIRRRASQGPEDVCAWFAVLVNAASHMHPKAKERLEQWERENLGTGDIGTSDWPGWAEFIDMELFWPWDWPQRRTDAPVRAKSGFSHVPRDGFFVYRLWTDEGRLAYVGASANLRNRLIAHRKSLGDMFDSVTYEEHPDAAAMFAAESAAIKAEHPALNKAGIL